MLSNIMSQDNHLTCIKKKRKQWLSQIYPNSSTSHAKAIEEFQDRPMAIPYSPQTKQTKHGFTHNLFHGICKK